MSFKRMLSLVLVLCMVLSFFPASAFAEDDFAEGEVVEGVVEEPAAEEPAPEEPAAEPAGEEQAEEPAAEEPAAEEPAEEVVEEVVEEEVVEEVVEAETTSEEAMAAKMVAMIDDDSFESLSEAVNAAGTQGFGTDIILKLTDMQPSTTISKTVTIDGSGNVNAGTGGTVTVTDGEVLIKNISIQDDFTVSGGTVTLEGVSVAGAVTVTGGSLTIKRDENGYGGDYSGAVTVTAPGTISVQGGFFSESNPINKVYLADGYVTDHYEEDSDVCWGTVEPADAKAMVGTGADRVYYKTLSAAIRAAKGEKVVVLLTNSSSPINFKNFELTTLYINKNGKTLSVKYGEGATPTDLPEFYGVTDPETGVTTYIPVAKVVNSSAKVEGVYSTFADAAKASVALNKVKDTQVEFIDTAVLSAGDAFTFTQKDETLKVVPNAIAKITKAVLDAKVLSPSIAEYAVVATGTDLLRTYSLEDVVVSILGKSGPVYFGQSEWNKAVEYGIGSDQVVLNMLANAPENIKLALNQFIVVAKNGFNVVATPTDVNNRIDEKTEDGKTTFKAVHPIASVRWSTEGDLYQREWHTNYFEKFADAAAFAVAANEADAKAGAKVTVTGTVASTDVYNLVSGSLTVTVESGGSFSPDQNVTGYTGRKDDGNTYVFTVDSAESVASITKDGDTRYFATFKAAAEVAVADTTGASVVKLLQVATSTDIFYFEEAHVTEKTTTLKIELNDFAKAENIVKTHVDKTVVLVSDPDSEGITTVSLVDAVAFVGNKYFATFNDAAVEAIKVNKTVQFVADAVLAEGDTYTLKATESLKAAPQDDGITLDVLKERILAPEGYAVVDTKVTPSSYNTYLFNLDQSVASIKGKDKTVTYGASQWLTAGGAVETAMNNKKVVLNMLADAPASGTIYLDEVDSYIAIAKNGFNVSVEPATTTDLMVDEKTSEDGVTTYRAIRAVAQVDWSEEDEMYKPQLQHRIFETFKEAAGFAVEKNEDDEADAKVTILLATPSDLDPSDTYNLETGTLTVGGIATSTDLIAHITKDDTKDWAKRGELEGVYYVWTIAETFTVTFVAGDGTPAPKAQKVEYGKTADKPATDPVKKEAAGKVIPFVGWFVEKAGAAENAVFDDKYEAYDFSTPVTGNVTIVAIYGAARIDNLVGKRLGYYDSFQDAAKAIVDNQNWKNLPVIPMRDDTWIVDENVNDSNHSFLNKTIRIADSDFTVAVKFGDKTTTANSNRAKYAVVVDDSSERWTAYTLTPAVATIAGWKDAPDPEYGIDDEYVKGFATVADAAEAAAGEKIIKVVAENQTYEMSDEDEVLLVDQTSTGFGSTFTVTSGVAGLEVGYEDVNGTTTPAVPAHRVYKLIEAKASIISNDYQQVLFFKTVDDAVASGKNSQSNPIILLADGMSYEMPATLTDLYVFKGEHEDFKVTTTLKSDNETVPDTNEWYAIHEETNDKGVTTYSITDEDLVAYIGFKETVLEPGFGSKDWTIYKFYPQFAEAAAESDNGNHVVVMVATPTDASDVYTMTEVGQVIKVNQGSFENPRYPVNVVAGSGLAVVPTEEKKGNDYVATVYTSIDAYATVTARFGQDQEVTTKTYGKDQLGTAVSDAVNNRDGKIVLFGDPGNGILYTFKDKDILNVEGTEYRFSTANFGAVEGLAVNEKPSGSPVTGYTFSTIKKIASVGEGDTIQYFDNVGAAVLAAKGLEEFKPAQQRNPMNPTAVITLWADALGDNDEVVLTTNPATATDLNSVFIKTQGYAVDVVKAENDKEHFIDIDEDAETGVSHYVLTEVAAYVVTDTPEGQTDEPFATFKEAAEKAFKNELARVQLVKDPTLDKTDVFKMGSGKLKVIGFATDTDLRMLLNKSIVKDGGDSVFLDFEPAEENVNYAGTFTVSGREASIELPGVGTKYFEKIESAIAYAKDKPNLVVTPLVSINRNLRMLAPGVEDGNFFMLAGDTGYTVVLSAYDVEEDVYYEIATDQSNPEKKIFKKAYFSVDTPDIDHYDEQFNPTYVKNCYANFSDAVAYADGVRVIDPLVAKPSELPSGFYFGFNEEDTFRVRWADTNAEAFKAMLTAPQGMSVKTKADEEFETVTDFWVGNYTITLDGNGGLTVDGKPTYEITDIKAGEFIDLEPYKNVFSKSNQTISNWTPDVPKQMPTGDLTFKAVWAAPKTVHVVWSDPASGKILFDSKQAVGQDFAVVTLSMLKPTPERAGFSLDENNLWTPEVPATVPDTDDTLNFSLNWIKQYNVSFLVDGSVVKTISVNEGSKLSDNPAVPVPEQPGMVYKWTLNGSDYDMSAAVKSNLTLTGTLVQDTITVDPAIELHEEIGFVFYINPNNYDPENLTVNFSYTSKYQTVNENYDFSGIPDEDGYYEFRPVMCASDEMSDIVTVTVKYKNGAEPLFKQDYSIASVADGWLKEGRTANVDKLLRALLQYGDKAQVVFGNHPDQHITPENPPKLVPIDPIYAPGTDPTTLDEYLEYVEFAIDLESKIGMTIYMKTKDGYGINDVKVTVTDEKGNVIPTTGPVQQGDEIVVKIPGLYPEELLNKCNVTVSVKGVSATYVRSIMSCAYVVEHSSTSSNVKELVEALYQYALAADAIW